MADMAFVFDVEGTLIDCVPHTLACWGKTFAAFGLADKREDFQRLSGMDGDVMLQELFPDFSAQQRKALIDAQGARYRADYLPRAGAFAGIRDLLMLIKTKGGAVALATDCQRDELNHYRRLMEVDDLIDAVACGSDVPHGKPDPVLLMRALGQLGQTASPSSAVMIGDTPFDARAARRVGADAFGVLSGGHTRSALADAGCSLVAASLSELHAAMLAPDGRSPSLAAFAGRRGN